MTEPGARPLRVLLVDDSDGVARALPDLLRRAPGVELVGRAADGEEGLRLALQHRPDLVLLDLEMPRMDGFTLLRLLMARSPLPAIVLSSAGRKTDVFKALELGALDFVAKPEGAAPDLRPIAEELLAKIALVRVLRPGAADPGPRPAAAAPRPPPAVPAEAAAGEEGGAGEPSASPAASAARCVAPRGCGRTRRPRVAVVGASTGGPAALARLLAAVPAEAALAWAVAVHMPERFTGPFAERLARNTGLDVREASDGDEVCEGRVLVAPGGRHLKLVRNGPLGPLRALLVPGEPGDGWRWCPSVDLLFASAADAAGERVCAVVLTGMGNDGRLGVERVKAAGGLALAESEESAVVYGMPREAADTGAVDEVLPLDGLGERLRRFAEGRR